MMQFSSGHDRRVRSTEARQSQDGDTPTKLLSLTSQTKMTLTLTLTLNPKTKLTLECGPMPNLMVALPNIGGALCSMPQSLADAH